MYDKKFSFSESPFFSFPVYIVFRIFISVLFISFLSACLKKIDFHSFSYYSVHNKAVGSKSLQILFVQDGHVNNSLIAGLLYREIYSYFSQQGYHLVEKNAERILCIVLENCEQRYKYISAEVLLCHAEHVLTFTLCIKDSNNTLLSDPKKYILSGLLSRPSLPTRRSDQELFCYSFMIKRELRSIDSFCRQFLS